jgi:hypothetical protein
MNITITLTGTHALLMHNSQLADPLNPFTRKLAEATSKRKKTFEDHEEVARREWAGGLYYSPNLGPFLPGANIERALLDGARMNRLGKSVERGLFITENECPLAYSGPRDIESLIDDVNHRHMASVKIGMSRVMRCRPIFRDWSVSASGELDEAQVSLSDLALIANRAGSLIGLGDWRPRFGRFTATVRAA